MIKQCTKGSNENLTSADRNTILDALKGLLEQVLIEDQIYIERLISYEKAGIIAKIRKQGQLVDEEYLAEGIAIKAYVPMELYNQI